MRQLIDVSFRDLTSYSTQVSGDVGAVVIKYPYGPDSELNKLDLDGFLANYPLINGVDMHSSWLNAYRALLAGLQYVEVVRYIGEKKPDGTVVSQDEYFVAKILDGGSVLPDRLQAVSAEEAGAQAVVSLKYRGNLPDYHAAEYPDGLVITIEKLAPAVVGDTDIEVCLVAPEWITSEAEYTITTVTLDGYPGATTAEIEAANITSTVDAQLKALGVGDVVEGVASTLYDGIPVKATVTKVTKDVDDYIIDVPAAAITKPAKYATTETFLQTDAVSNLTYIGSGTTPDPQLSDIIEDAAGVKGRIVGLTPATGTPTSVSVFVSGDALLPVTGVAKWTTTTTYTLDSAEVIYATVTKADGTPIDPMDPPANGDIIQDSTGVKAKIRRVDDHVTSIDVTTPAGLVLERVVGALHQGQTIDGLDWDIVSVLKGSNYFDADFGEIDENGIYAAAALAVNGIPESESGLHHVYINYTDDPIGQDISVEELCAAYSVYFSDIEVSEASLLIDPGTTNSDEASLVAACAERRMDMCALVGYPATAPWDKDSVIAWAQTISAAEKFTLRYCIRETFKLGGKTYITNGIGTLAGKYASVANNESINQIPSAKSWGSYGAALAKSFSFDDILEMHNLGINGCYNSVQGARLFGLRSSYPREGSYFARANVSRVTARLLKFAFQVSIDVLHTGNTSFRKAMTQLTLQADVDRLIGAGALRPESQVICSESNNHDIDTNGGRILIIDYVMWYVSLIERISIRVTATDSSVTADLSQG